MSNPDDLQRVRIDQWLWAARFYKTRSLAKRAVAGGKVHLNDQRTKPAKELAIGDIVAIHKESMEVIVRVDALAIRRGNATVAATLYTETAASVEQRQVQIAQRRMERAGLTIPNVKPSKRDRRDLQRLKQRAAEPD